MKHSELIELCYNILPKENDEISTDKWNSIFPKLMCLDNVHYVSAMPRGKGIDLTIGYKYTNKPLSKIIKLIEEEIKDEAYNVCFNGANYS
jgi:hypothetical protein